MWEINNTLMQLIGNYLICGPRQFNHLHKLEHEDGVFWVLSYYTTAYVYVQRSALFPKVLYPRSYITAIPEPHIKLDI